MSTEGLTAQWEQLRQQLKRFAISRGVLVQDADDLLQDIFIQVYTQLPTLQQEERLTAWIFQVTRNKVVDYHRKRRPSGELSEGIAITDTSTPLLAVDRTSEFATCIRRMIETLPDIYSEALLLTEIEGISQKELADRLDISHSGAKSRVQRGRDQLRGALLECCNIQTDAYGNVMDYHSRK